MRSCEEQMKEILIRRDRIVIKRQVCKLTCLSVSLALLLLGALLFAPGIVGNAGYQGASVMGSTILGAKAGGYVIVAILGFTLGIVVTICIQKYRKLK